MTLIFYPFYEEAECHCTKRESFIFLYNAKYLTQFYGCIAQIGNVMLSDKNGDTFCGRHGHFTWLQLIKRNFARMGKVPAFH